VRGQEKALRKEQQQSANMMTQKQTTKRKSGLRTCLCHCSQIAGHRSVTNRQKKMKRKRTKKRTSALRMRTHFRHGRGVCVCVIVRKLHVSAALQTDKNK
jgi:hypothetical protein